MKILWNQNPLITSFELDDSDKQRMLIAHQSREYVSLLCSIEYAFTKLFKDAEAPPLQIPDNLKEKLKGWREICNMTIESDYLPGWIEELETGQYHLGDCTCQACSCDKCYAETLLGVDTVLGCGQHELSKIGGAFGYEKDVVVTIDEALEKLNKPVDKIKPDSWTKFSQVYYESHIPRWEKEQINAIKWLFEI